MTFLSKVYILSFFSPSNSKGNAHVLNDHLTQGKFHYVSVKSTYADPQPIPGEEQTKPCRNHALAGARWLLHQHITGQSHHVYICRRVFQAKMAAATWSPFRSFSSNTYSVFLETNHQTCFNRWGACRVDSRLRTLSNSFVKNDSSCS